MDKPASLDIRDFTDMIPFANQSAAMEILMTLKSGVRTYAIALSECASADVRFVVKNQLFHLLDAYETLSQMMMEKDWLRPFHLSSQFELDIASADKTVAIASLPLFRSRIPDLETFDTPLNAHEGSNSAGNTDL